MSFHAAQRTQPKARQFALKLSYVETPYREVVDEISGAVAHQGGDLLELGAKLLFGGEGRTPQPIDAPLSSLESDRS
jgi:hypothetical protein